MQQITCQSDKQLDLRPIIELSVVFSVTICLAVWLIRQQFAGNDIALPSIFVVAAILPIVLNNRPLSDIGLSCEKPLQAIYLPFAAALIVFPITALGLWLLGKAGIYLPVPIHVKDSWLGWVAYQFMYVAVAEEIFFRGYVMAKLKGLQRPVSTGKALSQNTIILISSAMIFAAAHMILIGGVLSALTFFPGLILGWLYLRSNSILSPILFHGLANLFYALLVAYKLT